MVEKYIIKNNSISASDDGNILYYYNIDDNEKNMLINECQIDPHNLTSALDPEEVARLEIENDKFTLIWKVPNSFTLGKQSSFNITSIGFFLMNEKLIMISIDKINYFNERASFQVKSVFDAILLFLNNTVKHYIEHLKIIKLLSRELQKEINKSMENEYLIQMFNLSEILVYYLDAINSNKMVLGRFYAYLKSEKIAVNLNFLNDIIIENEQADKQAEIYSQIFAGLMDARGTIVNNNMNVLIKNLTIINIIFLPLNLIASILGMSEFSIMTKGLPWQISYSLFSLLMIIIGWITLMMINRLSNKYQKIKKSKKISNKMPLYFILLNKKKSKSGE